MACDGGALLTPPTRMNKKSHTDRSQSAESFLSEHGQYVYGNPFRNRKVILSKDLIRDNKLTPVTVVRPSVIVDRFLEETKRAT